MGINFLLLLARNLGPFTTPRVYYLPHHAQDHPLFQEKIQVPSGQLREWKAPLEKCTDNVSTRLRAKNDNRHLRACRSEKHLVDENFDDETGPHPSVTHHNYRSFPSSRRRNAKS